MKGRMTNELRRTRDFCYLPVINLHLFFFCLFHSSKADLEYFLSSSPTIPVSELGCPAGTCSHALAGSPCAWFSAVSIGGAGRALQWGCELEGSCLGGVCNGAWFPELWICLPVPPWSPHCVAGVPALPFFFCGIL